MKTEPVSSITTGRGFLREKVGNWREKVKDLGFSFFLRKTSGVWLLMRESEGVREKGNYTLVFATVNFFELGVGHRGWQRACDGAWDLSGISFQRLYSVRKRRRCGDANVFPLFFFLFSFFCQFLNNFSNLIIIFKIRNIWRHCLASASKCHI